MQGNPIASPGQPAVLAYLQSGRTDSPVLQPLEDVTPATADLQHRFLLAVKDMIGRSERAVEITVALVGVAADFLASVEVKFVIQLSPVVEVEQFAFIGGHN